MQRMVGLWALCVLLLGCDSVSSSQSAPINIAIVPLGKISPTVVQATAAGVRTLLGEKQVIKRAIKVVVLPPQPLPDVAYHPARQRYFGLKLLDSLAGDALMPYDKVLAITDHDIAIPLGQQPDWGVFGVARGRVAVVSRYRLRRGADAQRLQQRLNAVAVHELGHTFGLPHCNERYCVMRDAQSRLQFIDESAGQFGAACAQQLKPL